MATLGADELAAALHAPLRSELGALWGDDDASAASAVAVSPSSASSSGASSPALPPQQLLASPAAPGFFFPVGDLSAFLAGAVTQQQQQQTATASAATPNFLDDLLSSTDDLDFRVRGGPSSAAIGSSSSTSNAFGPLPLSHSLPPSIQQQLAQSLLAQRQLASGLGSLPASPFLALDGGADASHLDASVRGAAASRLLQLENNYERKKKRAKINRKDLNARFQELMDILNLKEDRKLNRAKVLEKTIEYIERLEDELHAMRAQVDGAKKAAAVGADAGSAPKQIPQQPPQLPPQQHPPAAQMLLRNPSGTGSIMAFNASGAHAWAAAGPSGIPMAPMMWLPCPMVAAPPSTAAVRRPTPPVASRARAEKRVALRVSKPGNIVAEPPVSTTANGAADGPRRSLKRTRDDCVVPEAASAVGEEAESVFVWGAQEIPTLLAFCDAWTLASLMQTSKEVAAVTRRNKLWLELSRHRWGLREPSELQMPNAREQWGAWHREMRMPVCGAISSTSVPVAAGRARGLHAWGLLARRSNGRTTRTVLVGGKAAVTQVVELYVVVQNMGQRAVRLGDQLSVGLAAACAGGGGGACVVRPFPATSGAHLTPQIIALNGGACVTRALESVTLRHGDACVLDVFLECPGLDLEREFLQRVEWLEVRCAEVKGEHALVTVRATRCVETAGKKQFATA
ncbi:hypothetical protein PybrP1_004606 [[Pythium] brassicae (nom. inval.)]|nr:hypothetical protein PybrP1_004606 [[Pythium] brassicae (nom. inval.)]